MTLAVTGATGFVGGHLLDAALAAGHRVRALTRRDQPPRAGVTWVPGTLADDAALDQMCAGADALIHVAGAINAPDRMSFARANIDGTAHVMDAAARMGAARIVHVSSLAAREPDLSDYGWSKAEAERQVRARTGNWVIVRPPGVYGPGDHETLELFRMARRGVMLLPPAGRGSWIHVDDLTRLLLALAAGGPQAGLFEPDDGEPLAHFDLARRIGAAVGRPRPITLSAPGWAIALAARADRLVRGKRAKLTPDRARYMRHPDWASDPAKSPPADLWQAQIPSAKGLASTADWYRGAGWLS